jgi:uncharacterized protein (TIGR03435 family)
VKEFSLRHQYSLSRVRLSNGFDRDEGLTLIERDRSTDQGRGEAIAGKIAGEVKEMIGKLLAVGLLTSGVAIGQTATTLATAATTAPVKAYAFDVVSIRQNNTPMQLQKGPPEHGPTADGYRMFNEGIYLPIMMAYVPQVGGGAFYGIDQIKGLPGWSERYDIDARISDEDRADWQKPEMQKVMLQSMLQSMLVERCKLAVHREIKELPIFTLELAKSGPKFKEADPKAEHPSGYKLPWGGVMAFASTKEGTSANFYGISLASLASWLSSSAGRPVQDKTGLTGSYDITLKFPNSDGSAQNQSEESASDPRGGVSSWVSDLGLKLVSAKGQVETLVIDHIERPSAN